MSYLSDKLENILNNTYEIEDYNGNTVCKFKINIDGDPVDCEDCNHADTDETVRIQLEKIYNISQAIEELQEFYPTQEELFSAIDLKQIDNSDFNIDGESLAHAIKDIKQTNLYQDWKNKEN